MSKAMVWSFLAAALLVAAALPEMAGAQTAGGSAELNPAAREEGERLVHNLDCNVCHTPKVMTPAGPQPDVSRRLSGHPAGEDLPPLPVEALGEDGWGGVFNLHLTAWAGTWGVSFGSNLPRIRPPALAPGRRSSSSSRCEREPTSASCGPSSLPCLLTAASRMASCMRSSRTCDR
jgi:hypothetical protein